MLYVRFTKTKSKATAVQVVKYVKRKTVILKHIGSSKKTDEIKRLKTVATRWIEQYNPQLCLFSQNSGDLEDSPKVVVLNKVKLISTHSLFVYKVLSQVSRYLGFYKLLTDNPKREILLDLVITRLIHPASKLESIQFLKEEFGIKYERSSVQRSLAQWSLLKDQVEEIIVNFAKKQLDFTFKVIFYDVTTLYFESFKSDEELKQCGFSKDNKFNQPQIVIGLVVNNQGFPISYQVFAGNKFEGHTFIPILENLQQRYKIKTLTVVADAAMISQKNVDELVTKKLHYIVGARVSNLPHKIIDIVYKGLNRQDQATTRIKTSEGNLICSFLQKRYRKDKHETEKQIARAEKAIQNPQGSIKRLKFVTTIKTKSSLNQKLIEKTKKLWGIKGYYTNLNSVSNLEIINQYRQLWKVEKSFRITKSDLQARPIYHRNTETIKSHILICFMALSLAKYMEIRSGLSLKKTLKILKSVKDAKMKNTLTNEVWVMRTDPSKDVDNLLKKLNLSY